MTNAEKYIKEELINTGGERFIYEFTKWLSDNGASRIENERINQLLSKFLTSTAKPTLTEDEKVILRNIPKDYVKIRRAKWIIDEKRMNYWQLEIVDDKGMYWTLCILSHLFQFIQPRRRI